MNCFPLNFYVYGILFIIGTKVDKLARCCSFVKEVSNYQLSFVSKKQLMQLISIFVFRPALMILLSCYHACPLKLRMLQVISLDES